LSDEAKVAVVACAGMDKALGAVAMLSVFKVTEELRPSETRLIALPPLLAGVAPYSELVTRLPVIVIDGCAERCATKLVAKSGGKIRGRVLVPDCSKKYGLTADSASNVGPDGVKLAEKVAEEVTSTVDRLCRREGC